MKYKDVVKLAMKQGFGVEKTKNGWKFFPPDPSMPILNTHGHDYNVKAILCDLKKRGLKI